MKKVFAAALLAGIAGAAAPAQAAFIPFGPQNDVAVATVTGTWGWSICYSASYATPFGSDATAALANCSGSHLMLAARRTGSDVFEVLAATVTSDALTNTGNGNVTAASNGSEWYYSPFYSWGFAGLGDTVNRFSCDTNGLGERDRLCWHTINWTGGWRAGAFSGLNSSTDWEKLILVVDVDRVPEPAALGLFGLGLAGIAAARRRRKA